MLPGTSDHGRITTRWDDIPDTVLACIMEEVNSYEDLGSFIRVSRATWDVYWSRRMSILLTLVPRMVGEECMREALGILRAPEIESRHASAWDARFQEHLADYQSETYRPVTLGEILPLQRLDARMNALLAYYHPKLVRRYDPKDYHSSEAWRSCSQCASNTGLKFTLLLYELFPPSVGGGPGFSAAGLTRHIGRKIKAFPLWQMRLGTDIETRRGAVNGAVIGGWSARRPF